MNAIRNAWERIFPPVHPIPAGIYPYQAPADAPFPYRLHLRIEADGSGLLIVNASTVVHLNATAAEYAYHLVKNTPEDQAVLEIARRYNARKEIILRDYHDLIERLKTLIETPDLDPVAFLDFEREELYSGTRHAPYRLDCALTYHLPDAGAGNVAPLDRVSRELTEDEWKTMLAKAWQAGIPHALFTGGEPTLRPDLCSLVRHAEDLGMVTGLITSGLRLAESQYLHELLQSGLDHVMILLDPGEEQCWQAIHDVLAEDIALIVHLTLTEGNMPHFDATLDRLAQMGVLNISLSADSLTLKDDLQTEREAVAEREMRLIWDMPVPYSRFNPVALELAQGQSESELETAHTPGEDRHAWLYVEPDGDVLIGQGRYKNVLGNLLVEPWEQVWENALKA